MEKDEYLEILVSYAEGHRRKIVRHRSGAVTIWPIKTVDDLKTKAKKAK